MDFNEFLPKEEIEAEIEIAEPIEKISQNQVYDIIIGKKPDWQSIIYDLINSEHLNPLDIDLFILTNKYFEKIEELDLDFYISSKVLLAASFLLRLKSEFLLNKSLKSIDEILFGKKESSYNPIERIEIDENDLPILIPKTPMARLRKVTLDELMNALNKAMNTETRRIKREVAIKRAHKLAELSIPEVRRIDLRDRIKQFYAKILTNLRKQSQEMENKISFTNLIGIEKEEKLASFLPLLHLSNSKKLWLEQEKHLDEIWVYLYTYFDKNREKFSEALKEIEELEEELSEIVEEEEIEKKIEKATDTEYEDIEDTDNI